MIPDFIAPSFISENDPDTIHERMMKQLPGDIDNTPGGFPWDFTRPTAVEKSELIEFHLTQTLMLMFPMWAWDKWLDYHAQSAGLVRKEAGYASGEVMINGIAGTVIPAGSVFATVATDTPSIEFITDKEVTINAEGSARIAITAVEAGINSNIAANTITLVSRPIQGITSLFNEEPTTGGTEEEDDESLRIRIQEANESITSSFIGNSSDYIRWAKEVTGVGSVIVVPEWDRPGTVKLVILDDNGQPANETIIKDVTNHIYPEDVLLRKSPIGAIVTVDAPESLKLTYSCKVTLAEGYNLESVIDNFKSKLTQYYETAKQEGVVKYTKVSALLSNTEGITDFSEFTLNSKTANIIINQDEYPVTVGLTMTENIK